MANASTITGRRNDTEPKNMLPGDYGKYEGYWYCMAPRDTGDWFTNYIGNISRHQITEHEDGTITVHPSIEIKNSHGVWHGWLERGVWRDA